MKVSEIISQIDGLSLEDRRHIAAHLVALRHRDMMEYRADLTKKIDDSSPEKWLTIEELDQRLVS
jgi:hypothetical protein